MGREGPVVLVIMDGVGYGAYKEGDAVLAADMRYFRALEATCPATKLKAHGTAVGLPSDEDMGNSEVGHNAIGCGRVFAQGARLVNLSIENGTMFQGKVWKGLVGNVLSNTSTLHFIGLFSDGNVHSHIEPFKGNARTGMEGWSVAGASFHPARWPRCGGQSALEYVIPLKIFSLS